MTFQRFLNRNHLAEGGYGDPGAHAKRVNTDATSGTVGEDAFKVGVFPHLATRVEQYEQAYKLLLGDLRRLQHDAVDENGNGICGYIAERTQIHPDTVAAVLKEFMAW